MKNCILLFTVCLFFHVRAQEKMPSLQALKLRNIGPATHSGRISDIAVHPSKPFEYYLAIASGGVWKTTNAGNTFSPVFDQEGSYSIGCVCISPHNPNEVWVGTGENNNQRSVAYGDGVYRSLDGGKTWRNMGLKMSEHIGMIKFDPKSENIIYVAAYGPLWKEGGERGLYKTEDGGQTWNRILHVDDQTGISEVHLDPRNPQHIYAVSHQRRRHVFTYIGGGPGSGIHKSEDGGKTWVKLDKGLPKGDYVGRIGLAIPSAQPDWVYAIVESSGDDQGFYRSKDRGKSWEKRSSYATSGNYYQEIFCDPIDPEKVFSMDTWLHHTEDGGKTFVMTGEKSKHVDNHAIWIDPRDTRHWLVGCDGGLYETWDHAENWHFKTNLPITQFYKVATDNSLPFYQIYGGTQDNNSMGGPSRTTNASGIVNSDWFITQGGDGFESQVDPMNPDIIYAQAQYGWLTRYDKKSGERVGIKPMEKVGEDPYRWNWDAPLLISNHQSNKIYFCAQKVFVSTNKGDDWTAISPDLTRQINRDTIPVMGKVWSMDAVMKNKSTSVYGNIVAFDESPKNQNLLYVGTDDGLIQVTENGGKDWRKIESWKNLPPMTYVNAIVASQHEESLVFAVFNNHKNGDFKPYIYKSADKGKNWTMIQGNLPERGTVYDIAEDHQDPNLLFAGTEFGLYFTKDAGKNWQPLKSGLPTIAVKDIEIQKRENDLVLATFGRGFYVLDDYSPLRGINDKLLQSNFHQFDIKTAWMFQESTPLGLTEKANQGESYYTAENPTYGVVFTYYFQDSTFTSLKEQRKKREAELMKSNKAVPYPNLEDLHKEDWENTPYLIYEITDEKGNTVRKIKTKPSTGLNRVNWDFRYESLVPVQLNQGKPGRYEGRTSGPMAIPGTYFVQFFKVQQGKVTELGPKKSFQIKSLKNASLESKDRSLVFLFSEKMNKMRRAIRAASEFYQNYGQRIKLVQKAIIETPNASLSLLEKMDQLSMKWKTMGITLYGDGSLSSREFPFTPGLITRVETTMDNFWDASSDLPNSATQQYEASATIFESWLQELKSIESELVAVEKLLFGLGAPYTSGSPYMPDWKKE